MISEYGQLHRFPALAALAVWALLALAPTALAADADTAEEAAAQEEQQQQAPRPQPAPMKDDVWGTMGDNIFMGEDAEGNSIIRVTPKPQPRQEPDYGLPPIVVEPHVQVPAQQKK